MHINFNSFCLSLNGGNRFIFELSNSLVNKNHKVTITHLATQSAYSWFSQSKAEIINLNYYSNSFTYRMFRHFTSKYDRRGLGNLSGSELFLMENMPDCDVNIATFCLTAYPTYYSRKGKGTYLIQHYEPLFFNDKKRKTRAQFSYELPLKKVCVSKWLTEKVKGAYIGNGINLDKYKPTKSKKKFDVMIIKRNLSWKGNYSPIISELKKKKLNVFVADGRLSDEEMVCAYNSSRLLLYLSEQEGFGYPPLEAMACGVPVITTPCVEYACHLENAYVLEEHYFNSDILNAIHAINSNEKLYDKLMENGLKTSSQYNVSKAVELFIKEVLN